MQKLKCENCKYMFVCFYSEESICRHPQERKILILEFRQKHQGGKELIKKLLVALKTRIQNNGIS